MTTYTITEAQRHQLLDAVTTSELDDVREVAEKMLQSLAPVAAPSTSQPLTNIEVEALAICRRAGHVSVSQVQRILSIGYNEAGEICQSIIDKGQCNELEITPSLKTHSTPLAAPSTSPEMSDDLHIAYMAGYNAGKLAHGIALPPPAK